MYAWASCRYRDAYRIEMEAFVKCVAEGGKPPCGVNEGGCHVLVRRGVELFAMLTTVRVCA